jgi:hypothetical protein
MVQPLETEKAMRTGRATLRNRLVSPNAGSDHARRDNRRGMRLRDRPQDDISQRLPGYDTARANARTR